MSTFRVIGGKRLMGNVTVWGSKNAATPLIAATLLTNEPCVLRGVPRILDVLTMVEILQQLGATTEWKDQHTLKICSRGVQLKRLTLPAVQQAIKSMRSSVLLLAPLLVRFGRVSLPEPGGCIIGKRPLDTHLSAFTQLGAVIRQHQRGYTVSARRLRGATIILPELSVTATENSIMAALAARGVTTVHIAAAEPHVSQLASALQQMEVVIGGIGTHTLSIAGSKRKLRGFDVTVIPDGIEAVTFALAGILTNGALTIQPVVADHILLPLLALRQCGARVEVQGNTLTVRPPHRLRACSIKALPHPGFPTDLQSPFGVLATQCSGTSLIHDPLYEGRMGYVQELVKMGANAIVCDPHRVLITGPTPLAGREIESFDLRSGATLLLAGLIARGSTLIHHAQVLDRGYEQIDQRLNALGASIQREE